MCLFFKSLITDPTAQQLCVSMQYFLALTTAYTASLIGTPIQSLCRSSPSGGGLAQILFDLAKQTNVIFLTPRVEKLNS